MPVKTTFELLNPFLKAHDSILDIGCRGDQNQDGTFSFYCNTLIEFHLSGNFNTLKGIDLEEISYNTLFSQIKNYANISDINLASWNLNSQFHFENIKRIKELYEFDNINLETRNITSNDKFDVIIISNILHFLSQPRQEYLLKYCIDKLNIDGLIYLEARIDKDAPCPANKKQVLDLLSNLENLEIDPTHKEERQFRLLFRKN